MWRCAIFKHLDIVYFTFMTWFISSFKNCVFSACFVLHLSVLVDVEKFILYNSTRHNHFFVVSCFEQFFFSISKIVIPGNQFLKNGSKWQKCHIFRINAKNLGGPKSRQKNQGTFFYHEVPDGKSGKNREYFLNVQFFLT